MTYPSRVWHTCHANVVDAKTTHGSSLNRYVKWNTANIIEYSTDVKDVWMKNIISFDDLPGWFSKKQAITVA